LRSLVPEIKAHHIRVIRSGVAGITFSQLLLLLRRKLKRQRSSDAVGNRVLNIENVGESLVKLFRPHRAAVANIDELYGNPKVIARSLHRTVQNCIYTKCASRRNRIKGAAYVL